MTASPHRPRVELRWSLQGAGLTGQPRFYVLQYRSTAGCTQPCMQPPGVLRRRLEAGGVLQVVAPVGSGASGLDTATAMVVRGCHPQRLASSTEGVIEETDDKPVCGGVTPQHLRRCRAASKGPDCRRTSYKGSGLDVISLRESGSPSLALSGTEVQANRNETWRTRNKAPTPCSLTIVIGLVRISGASRIRRFEE